MSNLDEYSLHYPLSSLRALGRYQNDENGEVQIHVVIFEEGPDEVEREVFAKTLHAGFVPQGASSRRWFLEVFSGVLMDAYAQGRNTTQNNISQALGTLMYHMGEKR